MNICATSEECSSWNTSREAKTLANQLNELGFNTSCSDDVCSIKLQEKEIRIKLSAIANVSSEDEYTVPLSRSESPLEQTLRIIAPDFDTLPVLREGESKIIAQWTDKIAIIRPKPTVYSYTMNRYGTVSGTDSIRMKFSSALFRKMESLTSNEGFLPRSAFLAEIPSKYGPLMAERIINTCNLEVRVKRYHIGSPLHRYRYTENYGSTQICGSIKRWSRFDTPIVCFDWRNPLRDEENNRLADEPISDDYATVWMEDVAHAKEMARQTFLWMEEMFDAANLCLIDMCIFIDYEGHMIYGEISPDCMRVHFGRGDPSQTQSGDKDIWREGRSSEELRKTYEELYRRLFDYNVH